MKNNKNIDIISLAIATDGYNGAHIEAIVKDAVEYCFINDIDSVTTEILMESKKKIKSISSTLKKSIDAIKEAVKDMDLKPASDPDNKLASRKIN